MKRIEAIIRPHKQAAVLVALAKVGITNVTVMETMGLARHKTFSRTYEPASRNEETQTGLIPKKLLLLFVADDQVQAVVDLIQPIAITGEPGDGLIAVSPLDQIVRVRPDADA
jgi:nitrogen regulatory protein P-II 1